MDKTKNAYYCLVYKTKIPIFVLLIGQRYG